MPEDGVGRWDECCRWSGWLAERGVTSVIVMQCGDGAPPPALQARTSDLPRVMIAAPVGTVMRWSGGGLRLTETGWCRIAADGVQLED
jgi:hypothetical protein